jgi:phenylalanyl-tRNA synthetase alpha chain
MTHDKMKPMSVDLVRELEETKNQGMALIAVAESATELDMLSATYLGKKSRYAAISSLLRDLSIEDKKLVGQALNAYKVAVSAAIETQKTTHSPASAQVVDPVLGDDTLPGELPMIGHLHPTTEVIRRINSFFRYIGFSVYEGPEIENNEFNFEKLNLPTDHPARELADTLYISEPEVLLRTHTSSVETRAMTQEKIPLRIVVPGKVYRNENANTTNNAMFYQYEGLAIDKGLSMADLKGTLTAFVKYLYGEDVKTRFRCKYYPQVEPGGGLDIQCTFCHGDGCSVCKYRGWIEVLGCGMVHPNVLTACGIDPQEWSGFAFGMGLDRLVMLTYGINDIRKLYNGELVFEEQV